MKPFIPISVKIYRGEPTLVDSPDLNSAEFRLALQNVLAEYNMKYELRDDIVYIEDSLANDRELMMNFTDKTLNRVITTHK
ncbi:MAG: hypothetical protein LBL13_01270 [Bacteroidales bacterium]|jgi:hypothetical protein|nr:hypothetical protein [Bacteroidales bacterium]